MAPRPQDTCVSVWLSPEQIKQLDTLAELRRASRSELLRQLIDDATQRAALLVMSNSKELIS